MEQQIVVGAFIAGIILVVLSVENRMWLVRFLCGVGLIVFAVFKMVQYTNLRDACIDQGYASVRIISNKNVFCYDEIGVNVGD